MSEETPLRARAFVLESGQTVVSDVTLRVTRNAREWIVFALIVALAVLVGFSLSPFRDERGAGWQQPSVPTGLPLASEMVSPAPMSDLIETTYAQTRQLIGTPYAIYVVLTEPAWQSPTLEPTWTPRPTIAPDTPVPDCMTGTTIPGSVCRAYYPTATVVVETPIAWCPKRPATPVRDGRDCIVPR